MENKHIAAAGGIALLILLMVLFLFQSDEKTKVENTNSPLSLDLSKKINQNAPAITDLRIEDLREGSGSAQISAGDIITVNYIGVLPDGQKFDSSYDRKTPFEFEVAAGKVIKGWDQGVLGMKVGGIRKLTIPANLAYGQAGVLAQDRGGKPISGQYIIPPNSPLLFQLELLGIKPKEVPTEAPDVTEEPTKTPTPTEEVPPAAE